jgi:DNA polymerase III gamma/tau subunit
MNIISTTEQALKYSPQPRLRFELALVQMASMDSSVEINELLEEIKNLKKAPAGNGAMQSPLPAAQNKPPQMMTMDTPAADYKPVTKLQVQQKVRLEPAPNPAPFTSQVLNEQMPTSAFQMQKEILPLVESAEPVRRDVSSDALRSGWRDFLNKYATGETGIHMLGQSNIVMPKFYNGEIIFQAANQFAADNIGKRKQTIMQHLSDFFGDRVSVKIAVGITADDRYDSGKDFASNSADSSSQGTAMSAPSAPAAGQFAAASEPAGYESPANTAFNAGEKHPVEVAIVELFGAKEYGTGEMN